MNINWYAVLTGFAVALGLSIVLSFVTPLSGSSVLLLAAPGLIGGFVAGYMVAGVTPGAVHGGLATVIGAVAVLAVMLLLQALSAELVGMALTLVAGVTALIAQALPGAAAGALGGWMKARREPEAAAKTTTR